METTSLHSNVSDKGIICVFLPGQQNRNTRTVGYWSHTLRAIEEELATTVKSSLVAVWAITLICRYLQGTHTTVRRGEETLYLNPNMIETANQLPCSCHILSEL